MRRVVADTQAPGWHAGWREAHLCGTELLGGESIGQKVSSGFDRYSLLAQPIFQKARRSKTKWEEKITAAGSAGRANESYIANEHLEFVLKTIRQLFVPLNQPISTDTNMSPANTRSPSLLRARVGLFWSTRFLIALLPCRLHLKS